MELILELFLISYCELIQPDSFSLLFAWWKLVLLSPLLLALFLLGPRVDGRLFALGVCRLHIPIVQQLSGDDGVDAERTHVGEDEQGVSRLLHGCEDTSQGAEEKHETCGGRQLTGASVPVVRNHLEGLWDNYKCFIKISN